MKKFKDGQYLLQCLEQLPPESYPSLIVLDERLPRLDVEELLGSLKSAASCAGIPILIQRSSISPEQKKHFKEMSAIGYGEKPNTMDEVVALAQCMVQLVKMESSIE